MTMNDAYGSDHPSTERRPQRLSSRSSHSGGHDTEQDRRRPRRISSRSSHGSGGHDGNCRSSKDRDNRNGHDNNRRKKDDNNRRKKDVDGSDLGYGDGGSDAPGVNRADLGYSAEVTDFPGVKTEIRTRPDQERGSNERSHLMQRTRSRRRVSVGGIEDPRKKDEDPKIGNGIRRINRRQLVRSKSSEDGLQFGVQKTPIRRTSRRASITAIASGAAVEGFPGMSAMNQEAQVLVPNEPATNSRNRRRPARRSSLGYSPAMTNDAPVNTSVSSEDTSERKSAEDRLENQKRMMQMFTKMKEEPKPVEVPTEDNLGYGDDSNGDMGALDYGDMGVISTTTDEVKEERPPSPENPPKRDRRRRRSLLGNIGKKKLPSSSVDDEQDTKQKKPTRKNSRGKKSVELSDMMQKTSIQSRGGLVVDRGRHNGSLLERIGTGSTNSRSNNDARRTSTDGASRNKNTEDRGGSSYSDRIMSMGKA